MCETVAGTPTGDPRNLTVKASDSAHPTETAPRLSPQQEDHMTRRVVTSSPHHGKTRPVDSSVVASGTVASTPTNGHTVEDDSAPQAKTAPYLSLQRVSNLISSNGA